MEISARGKFRRLKAFAFFTWPFIWWWWWWWWFHWFFYLYHDFLRYTESINPEEIQGNEEVQISERLFYRIAKVCRQRDNIELSPGVALIKKHWEDSWMPICFCDCAFMNILATLCKFTCCAFMNIFATICNYTICTFMNIFETICEYTRPRPALGKNYKIPWIPKVYWKTVTFAGRQ